MVVTGKRSSLHPGLGATGRGADSLVDEGLDDDLEAAVVEGVARGRLDLHDALAEALAEQLQGAVVAVGVVAGAAEEHVRGPRAAAAALVGVVAGAAGPPEILDGAVAGEAQGVGRVPDLAAPSGRGRCRRCVGGGGEGGAALDGAVGLDAEGLVAGGAAGGVGGAAPAAAELGFVGAEVADVVAGPELDAALGGEPGELGDAGDDVEEVVGLEEPGGVVGGAAHGHGELDLPGLAAVLDEQVEDLAELREREPVDLRVLAVTRTPSRARWSMAARAASKLPGTPRWRSWVAPMPSIETETPARPASAAAWARSGVSPRPPVVMVQAMPASRTARAMTVQSSRR